MNDQQRTLLIIQERDDASRLADDLRVRLADMKRKCDEWREMYIDSRIEADTLRSIMRSKDRDIRDRDFIAFTEWIKDVQRRGGTAEVMQ